MTSDTLTLIGLGLAGLFIVWLVFSLIRKVVGLLLLVALVGAGIVLWNNPAMLEAVLSTVSGFWG